MFGFGRKKSAGRAEPSVPFVASSVPKVSRRGGPATGRTLTRLYDAGSTDRLTASWTTTPLTADQVVVRNQRALVARSREQTANNDYCKAFLRKCRQNIVGPRGVQMQAQSRDAAGQLDTDVNEAFEAAWAEWSKPANSDVTGKRSLWAIQRLAITSAAQDGEFMIRVVTGRDAGPWGFALQVLDPQRCPVDLNEVGLSDGRYIRQGIEFNKFGRPIFYLFPASDWDSVEYAFAGRDYTRVPAEFMIHGFLEELVGQKRGLPWASTSLWRLGMLGGFEKAALVNARAGAAKGGFLEWDEGFGPQDDDLEDEIEVLAEPGVWQELPPGLKAKVNDPQYPAGEFSAFHKSMLRGASAGMGVLYNNLAHDLEGVSYSSIRQGTLDEREFWKEMQEWLVETLMERLYSLWLPRALLAGRVKVKGRGVIPAQSLNDHRVVSWQARRWDWIDPNADVKAAVASKDNLFASPGQIIRDRGRDPRAVWREVASDIKEMSAAGIPDWLIQKAIGGELAGVGGGGGVPVKTEGAGKDENDENDEA